jgi:hypothetical protein
MGLRFEVLTEVTVNSIILWDMTPCNLVDVFRHLLFNKLDACFHSSFSDSEDGYSMFLRNIDTFLSDCTESHPRRY